MKHFSEFLRSQSQIVPTSSSVALAKAMPKIPAFLLIILSTFTIIIATLKLYGFPTYSSITSPINHIYNVGDHVPFYVNKIGPLNNPSETYEYYDLPFCRPDQLIKKKETFGEVLSGDRLTNTRYDIKFQEVKTAELLCKKTLTREEVNTFRNAIQREYYFQMHYDDLRFWAFVGKNEGESLGLPGKGPRSYLFTHLQFEISYNNKHVVEVHAFGDPNHVVDITEDTEVEVLFTYSAIWNATSAKFATRMSRYSRASLLSTVRQLHRFSIIISAVVFMLTVASIVVLYWWNVKSNFRRHSTGDEDDNEAGEAYIDGDIFSSPAYLSLFCAVVGCGTQVFLVFCCLFVLIYLGTIEPYAPGTLCVAIGDIYTLTSAVAGYATVSLYCQFAEKGWERSVLLTGVVFTGPLLLVLCILNTVALLYGATAALPVGTILVMLLVYTFVAVPLLALGAIIGHRCRCSKSASSPKRSLRDISPSAWYEKSPSQMLLGGLLPFSGVLVELHLVYASLWSYKIYTQLSILFVTFSVLICLVAVLSTGLTYIQLSGEDPRWWWRSVWRGGSMAIFMFAYCIYFYARSQMIGVMQLFFFFGYNACFCYAFFLMLGAVSYRASLMYMSRIHHAVKSE